MKKRRKTETGTSVPSESVPQTPSAGWTFLTNHTHVLLCLYRNPEITLREVSGLVGITERMVQKIVAELVDAGYLDVTKIGRRNTYQIALSKALRHPLESHCSIGGLLQSVDRE